MNSKYIYTLGIALCLSACADGEKIVEKIEADKTELGERLSIDKDRIKQRQINRFRVSDDIYLGFEKIDTAHGDPLPESWTTGVQPLVFPSAVELEEVVQALRIELGVPVIIDDVFPGLEYSDSASAASVRQDGEENNDLNSQDVTAFDAEQSKETESPIAGPFTLNASGSWREILDHVASTFRTGWNYRNGVISFNYYDSATFTIDNVAGELVSSIEISNQAGGGGGGGGQAGADITASTRQTSSARLDIDIWDNLARSLAGRLPTDSRIVSTPALQSITVTAPAVKFAEIEEFFEVENERLSRQVAIQLDVYSVSITDREQQRLGLDIAFRDLQDEYGFSLNGVGPGLEDAGSSTISANIISPPVGSVLSQFQQSQLIAESLNRSGEVITVYEQAKLLSNLTPNTFQFTNQRSYICRREIAALGQGNQTAASVEPCVVSSGFRINLLPNIHDDGRMSMRTSISISELVEIERLGSAETLLDLPNLNVGDVLGQTLLSSGDSVIMTGFEQRVNRKTNTNGGHIVCTLFCGSDDFQGEIRKLYFVFTPTIVRTARPKLSVKYANS